MSLMATLHMHAQLRKHLATHSLNLPALPPGKFESVSQFSSIVFVHIGQTRSAASLHQVRLDLPLAESSTAALLLCWIFAMCSQMQTHWPSDTLVRSLHPLHLPSKLACSAEHPHLKQTHLHECSSTFCSQKQYVTLHPFRIFSCLLCMQLQTVPSGAR